MAPPLYSVFDGESPSFVFEFELDKALNNYTRDDWELHASLDFESQSKEIDISLDTTEDWGQTNDAEIVMVFKPVESNSGRSGEMADLEVSLVLNLRTYGKMAKDDLFRIENFWDRKLQIQLKLVDDPELVPVHFQILVNEAVAYDSAERVGSDWSEGELALLRDYKEPATATNMAADAGLRFSPRYKVVREEVSFHESAFSEQYRGVSKFKNLGGVDGSRYTDREQNI